MFHVKRRPFRFLLFAALSGLLLAGCIGSDGPRGWAEPVLTDDELIVSTGAGRLDGIDSAGNQIWRFPQIWRIPEKSAENLRGIYGAPVLSANGEVVFVGDYNGYVYAFRPGDFIPNVTIEQPLAAVVKVGGPVLGGVVPNDSTDWLYVTSEHRIHAIKASDMVRRIENRDAPVDHRIFFEAADDIWATPVVQDNRLLVASVDGNLYSLDLETGREQWRFSAGAGLVSTPAVVGDRVLVGGFGSKLYAVDLNSGSEVWSYGTGHWIWARPAVANGVAYFGDFDGVMHAVEVANGAVRWSLDLASGPLRAAPVVVNNMLVASTSDGWLFGIDTQRQQVAWQRDIGTALNADLIVNSGSVLLAPRGCVSPVEGGPRVYYTHVNPVTGELRSTTGVC
jgi:outer membrane protein assembly factor BamB